MSVLFGAVELGGTKTSCAVGATPHDLAAITTFTTGAPEETMAIVVESLGGHTLAAVGIASFGPVELDETAAGYGHVTTTPKPGWSGANVVGPVQIGLGVSVGFDTDVNGGGLGEGRWGAGRGLRSFVYVTVGTGIGGGAIIDGFPVHGLGHPEMGHMTVERHPDDGFPGTCPFHGACLEGLASGPAIERRFGIEASRLTGGDLDQALALEVFYITGMVRNLVYSLAPQRVIIGGGVSLLPGLVEGVARSVPAELSGYPGRVEHSEGFVVPAGLGQLSGLAGALVLAERAVRSSS